MACMTVMTGCGTDKTGDTGETGKKSEGYLVGFANNSDTYNYCAKFRTYLKEMTEAKGIDITVTERVEIQMYRTDKLMILLYRT